MPTAMQKLAAERGEHAAPLLGKLEQWLEGQPFLPKSFQSGKAATYRQPMGGFLITMWRRRLIDRQQPGRTGDATSCDRSKKDWRCPDVLSQTSG